MSDERLRELRRAWTTSADPADGAFYLKERLRLGRVDRTALEAAAIAGHVPSARALGRDDPDLLPGRIERLLPASASEPYARACVTLARLLLPLWEAEHGPEGPAIELLATAEEWVRCPCPEHARRAARMAADDDAAFTARGRLSEADVARAAAREAAYTCGGTTARTRPSSCTSWVQGLLGPVVVGASIRREVARWALGEEDPEVPLSVAHGELLELRVHVKRDGPPARGVYFLAEGSVVLGSSGENELRLGARGVDARHARISAAEDGTFLVEDLGSRLGTFVDGRRTTREGLSRRSLVSVGAAGVEAFVHPTPLRGRAKALAAQGRSLAARSARGELRQSRLELAVRLDHAPATLALSLLGQRWPEPSGPREWPEALSGIEVDGDLVAPLLRRVAPILLERWSGFVPGDTTGPALYKAMTAWLDLPEASRAAEVAAAAARFSERFNSIRQEAEQVLRDAQDRAIDAHPDRAVRIYRHPSTRATRDLRNAGAGLCLVARAISGDMSALRDLIDRVRRWEHDDLELAKPAFLEWAVGAST